jgi:hypothetical protein
MGGRITVLGMQFPTSFAGGMAMCASGPELFDYTTAVGAAAEVITGVQFKAGSTRDDVAKMTEILGTPPSYTEKGRPGERRDSRSAAGRGRSPSRVSSRAFCRTSAAEPWRESTTPSNRVVTNAHYKYRIDEDLGLTSARLDTAVRRKPADMEYRNPMGPFDELVPFDGKIERPLLTMHGTGDLFVPIHLEQALNRAVTASGNQRLLVQRAYRIPGHCGFNAEEQARSFDDLVKWVRQGSNRKART